MPLSVELSQYNVKLLCFWVGTRTKGVRDVDLIKVTAHDAQSGRRDEGQVELGEEAGLLLGEVER